MTKCVFNMDETLYWKAAGVYHAATLENLVRITRDLPRSEWAQKTMTRKEQCAYICREILGISDARLREQIWRASNEE